MKRDYKFCIHKAIFILICLIISSCYRDNICYCVKKRGCRFISVVKYDSITYVSEQNRFCPKNDFDTDSGFVSIYKDMKRRNDSIYRLDSIKFGIGVQDSVNYDTIWGIKGIDTRDYKARNYFCKCYE